MVGHHSTVLLVSCLLFSATGCQTIMHGTKQNVSIGSSPGQAEVWVDDKFAGRTPFLRELTRKETHSVRIEMEGYEPFTATLTPKATKWALGSFFLGLGIGLIVDAVSGGLFYIDPDHIHAVLITCRPGRPESPAGRHRRPSCRGGARGPHQ